MSVASKASQLLELHRAPQLLSVVNVWDVITAKVVADVSGTQALATASHSIAASYGYSDGEEIPVTAMIEAVGRIAGAVELPVSADLEGGYGDIDSTIRKAIGVGVVGANLEDQMRPVAEAAEGVATAITAAQDEGVPDFVLNARTDAFVKAGGRDPGAVLDDAIARCKAYLEAGAPCVFVPGKLTREQVQALVDELGPQRLTVIGVPGSLAPGELSDLGVARISYGPWTQRVALTAFADVAADLYAGGQLPPGTRELN